MLDGPCRAPPEGPYSLRLSGRLASDACRVVEHGTFRATIRVDDRLERVQAVQRPDGTIVVVAESDAGVDHVRFVLGLDDDHSEFLRRFADDPLLGETMRRIRGLRPMRTGTVAQALLRAVAGQLILASRARQIERTIIRASVAGARRPARRADLRASSAPSRPRSWRGSGSARGARAALIRLCRSRRPRAAEGAADRRRSPRGSSRERGLGPWSVGVVCLEGLGRYERGLLRDLGLVKLASALWGRRVEAEETDELLAPYGEWAGLASVYLLAGLPPGSHTLARARARSLSCTSPTTPRPRSRELLAEQAARGGSIVLTGRLDAGRAYRAGGGARAGLEPRHALVGRRALRAAGRRALELPPRQGEPCSTGSRRRRARCTGSAASCRPPRQPTSSTQALDGVELDSAAARARPRRPHGLALPGLAAARRARPPGDERPGRASSRGSTA